MFGAALIPIVTLLAQYAPLLASVAKVAGVSPQILTAVKTTIDVVEAVAPAAIKGFQDGLPTIKNVILTLRGIGGTPTEQLDRLDAIEAKIDADWDAALAKAKSDDAAASNKG